MMPVALTGSYLTPGMRIRLVLRAERPEDIASTDSWEFERVNFQ